MNWNTYQDNKYSRGRAENYASALENQVLILRVVEQQMILCKIIFGNINFYALFK